MLKKFVLILLSALSALNTNIVFAKQNAIEIGDYIQLGRYKSKPIIWRCIGEDENGELMLSDKVLCYKSFDAEGNSYNTQSTHGCGAWEYSTLRAWLNATEASGNIKWIGDNPPNAENVMGVRYDDEDGFLSSNNFNDIELTAIKTVSQWQILRIIDVDKNTNNIPFAFGYNYYPEKAYWYADCQYKMVSELSHVEGAMYRLNDTVFLLNEPQIYQLYRKFGDISAEETEYASTQTSLFAPINNNHSWWLRTGGGDNAKYVYGDENYSYQPANSIIATGVRPAFYLNEKTAAIKSGSGTKDDPYVIDGSTEDDITVFSDNEQVEFDVEPTIENNRTLVGMRAIFESLGADVEWKQDTQTAVAVADETTIQLQANNDVMLVNNKAVQLDTPARIIDDRTMVPLRAISEALNADVEWIDNLRRIVIDKPELPMDFGEGVGKENWQNGQFGDWKPDITKYDGGYSEYMESIGQK